jgi:glyoxylase-like metal-dependent hydrolase (beta-lactamase superfamily II)
MSEYKVKPVALLTTEADKSGFTYMAFPGVPMKLDVAYFIIEGTPNKSGRVLVDTGTYAASMAKYWPGKAEDVQSFEDSLKNEGMTVDDIDIIIQTHLHHDHCVNTSKCKNAEVYVQEEEWSFAMAPHPLQSQYYPKEIYKGWKLRLIKGDYELFPGLRILHTPGHTPGTQSLAIQTAGGTTVIPGMCSIYQTFDTPSEVLGEDHPFSHWEVFSQAIATDMNQSYASNLRLKTIADVMIPCHGPGFCEQTKEYVDK